MPSSIVSLFPIFFLPLVVCRDAVQYFVAHRKIKYVVTEEIQNIENASTRWIEYKYVFDNTEAVFNISNTSLKIGVFVNEWMKSDRVECQISKNERNQTIVKGYQIDVVENLQQLQGIR